MNSPCILHTGPRSWAGEPLARSGRRIHARIAAWSSAYNSPCPFSRLLPTCSNPLCIAPHHAIPAKPRAARKRVNLSGLQALTIADASKLRGLDLGHTSSLDPQAALDLAHALHVSPAAIAAAWASARARESTRALQHLLPREHE